MGPLTLLEGLGPQVWGLGSKTSLWPFEHVANTPAKFWPYRPCWPLDSIFRVPCHWRWGWPGQMFAMAWPGVKPHLCAEFKPHSHSSLVAYTYTHTYHIPHCIIEDQLKYPSLSVTTSKFKLQKSYAGGGKTSCCCFSSGKSPCRDFRCCPQQLVSGQWHSVLIIFILKTSLHTCRFIVPFPVVQDGSNANFFDGVPLVCGGSSSTSSCYKFDNKTWIKVNNCPVH